MNTFFSVLLGKRELFLREEFFKCFEDVYWTWLRCETDTQWFSIPRTSSFLVKSRNTCGHPVALYITKQDSTKSSKSSVQRDVSPKLNVLPLLPKIAVDTNIICVCYTPFCAVAHLEQGMNVVSWSLPGNKGAFVLGCSWGLESTMDDENLVFAMPAWIHQTKGFLQHTIKTFLSSKEMAQERYEVMPFLVLVLEFDI